MCRRCFTEPGWNAHEPSEIRIDDFQSNRSFDETYRTSFLPGLFAHMKRGFYHDGRFATSGSMVEICIVLSGKVISRSPCGPWKSKISKWPICGQKSLHATVILKEWEATGKPLKSLGGCNFRKGKYLRFCREPDSQSGAVVLNVHHLSQAILFERSIGGATLVSVAFSCVYRPSEIGLCTWAAQNPSEYSQRARPHQSIKLIVHGSGAGSRHHSP